MFLKLFPYFEHMKAVKDMQSIWPSCSKMFSLALLILNIGSSTMLVVLTVSAKGSIILF